MTMTRTDKAKAQIQLANAANHGYTSVRFESLKLQVAAMADRGHHVMTGAEYREHRLRRGHRAEWEARELWNQLGRRYRRRPVRIA